MRNLKMLLTMIMSLFSSILFGLAPCNFNCAALDKENTIEEKKFKSNYFDNYSYSIYGNYNRYSLSAFTSDAYWKNMVNSFNENLNSVMLGQDGSTYTYNDVLNNGSIYQMNSNLVSLFRFYYIGTNDVYEIPSSSAFLRYCTLRCEDSSSNMKIFYLKFGFTRSGNTEGEYTIECLYNSVIPSYNCSVSYTGTFVPIAWLFGMPSSQNAICVDAGDTSDFSNGYDIGYSEGQEFGYNLGVSDTERNVQNPDNPIYQATYNTGKQVGDSEGYQRAISQGSTAATIFSGFLTVGLLPVNVLLTMFQYEVFGINIAGLVSGLFTIAVVIIIIRLVTGKKND